MTLTLPTPDAGDTARQRFALELLLQQPVPGPEQLLASRNLLSDALPDVSPDQWRALQAMPIAIGADHLDIAIPSQWRDQEWQHLIDQLPDQHRTIRLHPAIEADLQRALATETDQPTTKPNPPAAEQSNNPAPAETASTLDVNAESFLHDFNPDGVLESDEDDDAQLARDAIDLEASLNDAEASPVVTLVDRILLQAMSVSASDIHVEPQQKGLRLRYRQDGVLQQYIEPLPSPINDPGEWEFFLSHHQARGGDQVQTLSFRFKEKGEPMNTASGLAGNLQEMPPEHVRTAACQLELELARAHLDFGWITSAEDHVAQARELAKRDDDVSNEARAMLLEAEVALWSGDATRARFIAASAVEMLAGKNDWRLSADVELMRIAIELKIESGPDRSMVVRAQQLAQVAAQRHDAPRAAVASRLGALLALRNRDPALPRRIERCLLRAAWLGRRLWPCARCRAGCRYALDPE